MFHYMMDFLMQPIKGQATSLMSLSSESSSRRPSLSSSRSEFRPIHSEIIRRNLKTEFLEATSLPVNVLTHRSRDEAGKMFASRSWEEEMGEEDLQEWEEEKETKRFKKYKQKRRKMSEDPDLMFLIDIEI